MKRKKQGSLLKVKLWFVYTYLEPYFDQTIIYPFCEYLVHCLLFVVSNREMGLYLLSLCAPKLPKEHRLFTYK